MKPQILVFLLIIAGLVMWAITRKPYMMLVTIVLIIGAWLVFAKNDEVRNSIVYTYLPYPKTKTT